MTRSNKINNGKADNVKVRMYCHGFGDCFLLTFQEGVTPVYRMLIDCGMLTGNTELMKQAILNIKEDCSSHLNLVVQTHEHKDHISGFNTKEGNKLLWDSIIVDKVWLAWTENTGDNGDELANKLKNKQKVKVKALANAIGLYKTAINSDEHQTILHNEFRGDEYLAAQERYSLALEQILNFFDINIDDNWKPLDGDTGEGLYAAGKQDKLTVEKAMSYFIERKKNAKLPETFRPGINFWNPGDIAEEKHTGLKGVRFYFLGPPKDPKQLRLMEDKAHIEMYVTDMGLSDNFYAALAPGDEEERSGLSPFSEKYILRKKDIPEEELAFDEQNADHVWNLYHWNNKQYTWSDNGWKNIDIDWLHNTGALALHLDSYTNNTSLAFAIEFEESGKVLLFPGDAQIGNWISWTAPESESSIEPNLKWVIKKNGENETVTAQQLLSRTVFYKVGHHASHNATAKKHGLELMTSDALTAMIPVDEDVAKGQGQKGWKMPAEDLYKRLQEKTRGRIIRLDKGNILNNPTELFAGANPDKKQMEAFESNIIESDIEVEFAEGRKRPLYYEQTVNGA